MSSYANSGRRAIDAATFLKGKASPLGRPAEESASTDPDTVLAGLPSGASEPVSEQSPPLIFKDTTPSGIVVEYQSQPKRLYRVNGVEVPSVTTVLDSLSKPGLSWWGQGVGIGGVLELVRRGLLFQIPDWRNDD